jgi:hypothetical protein
MGLRFACQSRSLTKGILRVMWMKRTNIQRIPSPYGRGYAHGKPL